MLELEQRVISVREKPKGLDLINPEDLRNEALRYIQGLTTGESERPAHPPSYDAIVVLGGNIVKRDGHYMTTTYGDFNEKGYGAQGRVITAAILFHLGCSDCIVLSAGKTNLNDKDAPTESAVMKLELMSFGVPEGNIIREDRSTTTETNAIELRKLFDIDLHDKKNIGIVTNSWHIRRTNAFFKKAGFIKEGRTVKYISSDVQVSRFLPKYERDIKTFFRCDRMKNRIEKERQGYRDLQNGTYVSLRLA